MMGIVHHSRDTGGWVQSISAGMQRDEVDQMSHQGLILSGPGSKGFW